MGNDDTYNDHRKRVGAERSEHKHAHNAPQQVARDDLLDDGDEDHIGYAIEDAIAAMQMIAPTNPP